jgi:hypothetical protein
MEAEDHMDRPDFPTVEQVEKATHEPKEQQKIQDRIAERFKELGGMNPALSKKIGFSGAFATVCYHFGGITPKSRLEIPSLRAASHTFRINAQKPISCRSA